MTWMEPLRRAFAEFLRLPTLFVLGALLLATGMITLDQAEPSWLHDIREAMGDLVFTDPRATSDLLSTVAGSLITVTGITFTVVLIAVQQSASSLTHAVFDQFLRRRANQAFLGFFVGLVVYLLAVLATTGSELNPVLSATVGLALTFVALYVLVLVVYMTVDQMRPAKIIEAISAQAVRARRDQADLLASTRREVTLESASGAIRSPTDGFVTRIDVRALAACLPDDAEAEIELKVCLGTYVAHGDVIAEVRPPTALVAGHDQVVRAVTLGRVRDAATDAAFGVYELVSIAWTSISTSKQSPAPGRLVIASIRDLLGVWATAPALEVSGADDDRLPVVYRDDVIDELWDAVELMTVVCSESMQTQNVAELVSGIATVLPRLAHPQQRRAALASMVMISSLGEHVLTTQLRRALEQLEAALRDCRFDEADSVRTAREELSASLGRLSSRATRVPSHLNP